MEFIKHFGGNACSSKATQKVTKQNCYISWLICGAGIA